VHVCYISDLCTIYGVLCAKCAMTTWHTAPLPLGYMVIMEVHMACVHCALQLRGVHVLILFVSTSNSQFTCITQSQPEDVKCSMI
jgi:hypothetical protein